MATTATQRAAPPTVDPPEGSTPEEASRPQAAPGLSDGPDARAENTPAQDVQVTDEDIRLEAYLLHVRNGSREGREIDDWLEAEQRLRQRGLE